MTEREAKPEAKPGRNRRLSRELALKGLYQRFLSGNEAEAILRNLQEESAYARADQAYCAALLNGVIENLPALDAKLAGFVDRKVAEISPVEHAILSIAGYELAFDPDTAGAYAAGSIGARGVLLVPIAVTTVLFPRVATLRDPSRERRHLRGGLAAVVLAAAPLTAILWVFAGPLIDLTFGSAYEAAEAWLGPLSLAMTLYALATVYLYHFLSLGRSRFALVLVALLGAQLAVFAGLHGSPEELVGVQIGFGAATLVAAEAWHALRDR